MAEFTLNRNHTHRSLTGHTIRFEKGVPTFVPPPCHHEVIAFGAERIDGEQGEGFKEPEQQSADPQGDERRAQVYACFDALCAKNAREDFTAQGAPHIKAIRAWAGFVVDNKERDKLWADYRAMKGAEE